MSEVPLYLGNSSLLLELGGSSLGHAHAPWDPPRTLSKGLCTGFLASEVLHGGTLLIRKRHPLQGYLAHKKRF